MSENPYKPSESTTQFQRKSRRIGYLGIPKLIKGVALSWTIGFVIGIMVMKAVTMIDGYENRLVVPALFGFVLFLVVGAAGSLLAFFQAKSKK